MTALNASHVPNARALTVATTTDTLASANTDALVLRAIAARLRARSLPPTLRRLADLDAALIEQVAGNVEGEYTR